MAETELQFDGKPYVPSKVAAEITGYAQDYVGQLARGAHILAKRVGGLWYVELESIKKHKEEAEAYVREMPVGAVDRTGSIVSFDGKEFVSSKRAAQMTHYAQDYVGQLARSLRIGSRQVAGRWYVSKDDLLAHKKEKDGLLAAVQAEAVGIAKPTAHSQQLAAKDTEPLRRVGKELPLLTYIQEDVQALPKLTEKEPRLIENKRFRTDISDYRHAEQVKNAKSGSEEENSDAIHHIAIHAVKRDMGNVSSQANEHGPEQYGYSSQGARTYRSVHKNAAQERRKAPVVFFLALSVVIGGLLAGASYAITAYAPSSVTAQAILDAYAVASSAYDFVMDSIGPNLQYTRGEY